MTRHRLTASQVVAHPIDEVFAFFANPENLGRITPPAMGFQQLTADLEMRTGLEIDYRITPLLGIPMGWRTRIEAFDPPHSFADTQLKGPYKRWEHRHTFTEVAGGTRIEDELFYELPLGPLGALAHRLVVRDQLLEIFRHRARTIESIFATPAPNPQPLTVGVAGGTGLVGGGIAAELFRRGHRVVVLSHEGEAARGPLPDSVELRHVDVTTGEGLPGALHGLDALAIALAFKNSPIEAPRKGQTFMAVDAAGTERLAVAARAAGVKRLVYISGAGAAPDARRHWFRAKWRAETAIRASGVPFTIIRPTWIFGPRDVSLNRFIGFARTLFAVPLTNTGRQLLAPVFIDDAARLAADSIVAGAAANEVFELGGPETMPFREVVGRALRAARLRRPIVPGPTPLIKLAAVPLSLLPTPILTPAAVDFINQPATVDLGPLLERMPRRLTPLDEALATYLSPESSPATIAIDAPAAGGTRPRSPESRRAAAPRRPPAVKKPT
ncbi:MAG TPA: NAD(P)H-binding protein [Candidatus Limnocylindria bacterium]|nr:NAD(P)H-binding protein [Candidatus Limnocylindria bacterium]